MTEHFIYQCLCCVFWGSVAITVVGLAVGIAYEAGLNAGLTRGEKLAREERL